jgi:hypothetical protein
MSAADRTTRMLDPFDTMRANRLLAPTDPKINDIRWLVGEALRRTHQRAKIADQIDHPTATHTAAHDKLRAVEDRVGPHAWPIVTRIVIEGAGVRDCRGFVPELATPWRADAVVSDRLRMALDMLGGLMGVTAGREKRRE